MNYRILTAGVAGFLIMTCTAAAQPRPTDEPPPAIDDLRRAIATLPTGRLERPSTYDMMTAEQQRYLGNILQGPRSAVSGPLAVMLASPTLGDLAQRTMAYARFAGTEGFSSVPPKLNELAILMAARLWNSPYVWEAHDRYAVRMGLAPALVDAIRLGGEPPPNLEPDVRAVYAFVDELLRNKAVTDATFAAARTALGSERALVDLIGTLAIYQMSAMLTAVDRTGLETGELPALRPLN